LSKLLEKKRSGHLDGIHPTGYDMWGVAVSAERMAFRFPLFSFAAPFEAAGSGCF